MFTLMHILLQTPAPVIPSEFKSWAETIGDLGALGVLTIAAWLFVKGKIMSSAVADKMIKNAADAARIQAGKEIAIAVKCAVKDGIVEAYYEIMHSGGMPAKTRSVNTDDRSTEKEA